MKLSKELEVFRCDRPSEWKMDEFIYKALELEATVVDLLDNLDLYKLEVETLKQQLPSTHRCFITNQGMELLTRKLEEYNE